MPEIGITTYSKEAQQLYERGIAAARGGQRRIAVGLLTRAVQLDPRHEQAWLWLSGVLDDPHDMRFCLQAALKLNPANQRAAKGLAVIDQKIAELKNAEPKAAPQPSRIRQLPLPDTDAPAQTQEAAPSETWWQELRSSSRAAKWTRRAGLGALIALLIGTIAIFQAADLSSPPPVVGFVPTAQPSSNTAAQQTILNAPEANQAQILRYLSEVQLVRDQIATAATSYVAISDSSTVAAEQIDAARTYRDVLRDAYTAMERIEVPEILASAHNEYKLGIEREQAALNDLLQYYTNYNIAIANRSALQLQEAGGHYEQAILTWDTYRTQLAAPAIGATFTLR